MRRCRQTGFVALTTHAPSLRWVAECGKSAAGLTRPARRSHEPAQIQAKAVVPGHLTTLRKSNLFVSLSGSKLDAPFEAHLASLGCVGGRRS
jgi:hypothetical protein